MTLPANPTPIGTTQEGTVPALGSLDLDTVPLSNFSFLRYFLTAKNTAGLGKSMDISIVNNGGALED